MQHLSYKLACTPDTFVDAAKLSGAEVPCCLHAPVQVAHADIIKGESNGHQQSV